MDRGWGFSIPGVQLAFSSTVWPGFEWVVCSDIWLAESAHPGDSGTGSSTGRPLCGLAITPGHGSGSPWWKICVFRIHFERIHHWIVLAKNSPLFLGFFELSHWQQTNPWKVVRLLVWLLKQTRWKIDSTFCVTKKEKRRWSEQEYVGENLPAVCLVSSFCISSNTAIFTCIDCLSQTLLLSRDKDLVQRDQNDSRCPCPTTRILHGDWTPCSRNHCCYFRPVRDDFSKDQCSSHAWTESISLRVRIEAVQLVSTELSERIRFHVQFWEHPL